jgi:hypothetical protein
MFNFLRRRRASQPPTYTGLEALARQETPATLLQAEESSEFRARQDALVQHLMSVDVRPGVTAPAFFSLRTGQGGVLTIPMPNDSGQCVPIFTSPYRAADYCRVVFQSADAMQYAVSSATEVTRMFPHFLAAGITSLTVDRCPRCAVFAAAVISAEKRSEDLLSLWAIAQASRASRVELWLDFAGDAFRRGDAAAARDVLMQCVAHVSGEDRRVHLFMREVAQKLGNRRLEQEAEAFLQFLAVIAARPPESET